MDFLLECIGFPPGQDLAALASFAKKHGEGVPWRGRSGEHLRLALGGGLEVRLDRDARQEFWTLTPWFQSARRVRVAVETVARAEDAHDDVLISGFANPPLDASPELASPDSWPVRAWISDGRRLPRDLERGRVIALALAGFALDVGYVGGDEGARDPTIPGLPFGAAVEPVGDPEDPGSCLEVSLRVRTVERLFNALTGREVDLIEVELPGRPLPFFVSPWQLEERRLPRPRPGSRIEGAFTLCGRVAGGLGGPSERLGARFG